VSILPCSACRSAVVWLLACLVPLQALAAGVIAVAGPAHSHRPAASVGLVLDDFRRAPAGLTRGETHAAGPLGHFHGVDSAERHHHAAGDPTVVIDPADQLRHGDSDDPGFSPSLALFVGLVSAPPSWPAAAAPARPIAPARWSPRTHHPALPERPPRAG